MSERDPAPVALVGGAPAPAVIRTGLLSMLALIALGGTRLIHSSLVFRATDYETFSLVGILIAAAVTAGLFLPAGLASAASKFLPYLRGAGDHAGSYRVYRALVRGGYAAAAGLALVVGLGMGLLFDLSVGDSVSVGLLTAAFSLYSVEKGALYGFDRVAPYVRLELVCSAVAIAATVLVVAVGATLYLAPLTLGYAILVAGAWWTLRRRRAGGDRAGGDQVGGSGDAQPSAASTVTSREVIGFVALASVGALASAGLLQLLPLLARSFTTPVEVSYFVAVVNLVAPLYFLPRALGMALFPAMAHAHGAGDRDTVRRHLDISTRALMVLLAPLFACALLLARDVLFLFGNERITEGAALLRLVLVATYLAVIQVAAVNALSSGSRRDVRVPVFSAVAGLVVALVALVPLGHFMGAAGVALAYLAAVIVQAGGPIVAAWRKHEMAWTGPLVGSLGVVVGALAVAYTVDTFRPAGAGGALLDVAVAVLVLAAGTAVLRRDIRAVLESARRRR